MLLSFLRHPRKFLQKQQPSINLGKYTAALLLICLPPDVIAIEWLAKSEVSLKAEYNDNKRLTTLPHDSTLGSILGIKGRLGILTENTEMDLTPRARFSKYSRDDTGEDSLDSNDYFLDLNSVWATERMLWGLNGKYSRDTSLTSELEDTGLVQTRKRREKVDLDPTLVYELNEWTNLQFAIDFALVEYKNAALTGLVDYSFKTVNITLLRETGEREKLNISLSASRFEAVDINSLSDHFGLVAVYKRNLANSLDTEIKFGLRRSEFKTNQINKDNGVTFKLGVTKKHEYTNWKSELSRLIKPSGFGSVLQKDRFSVNATQFLTDTLRAFVSVSALKNKELESIAANINRVYKQFEVQLHWQLTEKWSMRSSYRYRRNENNNTGAADSNAILFEFFYRPSGDAIN